MIFKLKVNLTKSEITSNLRPVSEPDSKWLIPFVFNLFRKRTRTNAEAEYLGTVQGDYFQLRRYTLDEKDVPLASRVGVSGFLSEQMNRTEIIFWVRPIFEVFLNIIFFGVISVFAFMRLIPSIFNSNQQVFSMNIVAMFLSLWIYLLWNYFKSYQNEKAHWYAVFEEHLAQ